MMIGQYCSRVLGMNLEEFIAYEEAVKTDAKNIYNKATKIRPQDTGMYYPVNELIEVTEQRDYYVIDELKKLGVEFIENYELYRV